MPQMKSVFPKELQRAYSFLLTAMKNDAFMVQVHSVGVLNNCSSQHTCVHDEVRYTSGSRFEVLKMGSPYSRVRFLVMSLFSKLFFYQTDTVSKLILSGCFSAVIIAGLLAWRRFNPAIGSFQNDLLALGGYVKFRHICTF